MRAMFSGLILLVGCCGGVQAQDEVEVPEILVAFLRVIDYPVTAAREAAAEARERLEAEFEGVIRKLPDDAPDIEELEKQRAAFTSEGLIPTHPAIRKAWDRYLKEVEAAEKKRNKELDEIVGYAKRGTELRAQTESLATEIKRTPLIPGIAGILAAWSPKDRWRDVVETEATGDGKAQKPMIWTVRSRDDYRIVLERPASHVRGTAVFELVCDKTGGIVITDARLEKTRMKIEVVQARGSGTISTGSLEFAFLARQRKAGTEAWEDWGPVSFKIEPHEAK